MPGWGLWGAEYEARYTHLSQVARRRRVAARQRPSAGDAAAAETRLKEAEARLRARFNAQVLIRKPDARWWPYVELMRHDDPDAALVYRAGCEPLWRERRAIQAAERAEAVRTRARQGYNWDGGPVGGKIACQTPAFQYSGLVSDDHPVLKLFVSKLPRGRRLISGDGKDSVATALHGSKLLGCDDAYIEGLKTMRGFIRIEIDRDLTWADIAVVCQKADVPPPNIVVGWVGPNGVVWHPHLIWLLQDSVAFTPRGKPRFKGLFNGVLRGLTAALSPYGADHGGISNCMRLKNPLSPLWQRRVFAEQPYSLDNLRRRVDTAAYLPQPAIAVPTADHPDNAVASGSNAVFRYLVSWARGAIRPARDEAGRTEAEWQMDVEQQALSLASALTSHDSPNRRSDDAGLCRLAAKIARWTWKNVPAAKDPAPRLTAAEVATRQAEAGRLTAGTRAKRSLAAVIAAARILNAKGRTVTQAAVFAIVSMADGIKSKRTVERHWKAARAALTLNRQTLPYVKKESSQQPGLRSPRARTQVGPDMLTTRARQNCGSRRADPVRRRPAATQPAETRRQSSIPLCPIPVLPGGIEAGAGEGSEPVRIASAEFMNANVAGAEHEDRCGTLAVVAPAEACRLLDPADPADSAPTRPPTRVPAPVSCADPPVLRRPARDPGACASFLRRPADSAPTRPPTRACARCRRAPPPP
jgi:hypothetical protein